MLLSRLQNTKSSEKINDTYWHGEGNWLRRLWELLLINPNSREKVRKRRQFFLRWILLS